MPYIKDLIDAGLKSKPGLHIATVSHDDWCLIFKGGKCTCNPDIVVKESPAKQSKKES